MYSAKQEKNGKKKKKKKKKENANLWFNSGSYCALANA